MEKDREEYEALIKKYDELFEDNNEEDNTTYYDENKYKYLQESESIE